MRFTGLGLYARIVAVLIVWGEERGC